MDGRCTNINTYIDSPRATDIKNKILIFYYFPEGNYKSLKVFSFIWIALYFELIQFPEH